MAIPKENNNLLDLNSTIDPVNNSRPSHGIIHFPRMILKSAFILFALTCYCAVVPVFALCMFPIYLYRWVVTLLQKYLHPEWISIMSSRDAIVGLDDTTKRCDCMIVASCVFRGVPDIPQMQAHFQKHVMEIRKPQGGYLYRKLTYYYENWMGFPFWKPETNFKLEDHLRLFDHNVNFKKVTRPGTDEEFITEEELLRCLGEIEKLPFPKGCSPWEIMILPNVIPRAGHQHEPFVLPSSTNLSGDDATQEKYFSLVYRVHHAIGDGFSFMKMLMSGICNEPTALDVPRTPNRNNNIFAKIFIPLAIIVLTPYYHFKQFFIDIDRSIWHLPSKALSKQNHFVSTERIPMESLKQVGKAFKVPLTGVLLAGLSGGIHNFFKLTGKSHLSPRLMQALSPMPWKDHPAFSTGGLVNHWTVGVFAIPVGEKTPQERLRACRKSMNNVVNSPVLLTNFLTVPLLLSAPNCFTDFWGTNWMTSMILSNFPGPKHSSKSFGKYPMDNIITYVPHMRGSAGLGVMFPTCLGNVRCTVSVDKSIMKEYSDAQLLVGLIAEEFKVLQSLHKPNADNFV